MGFDEFVERILISKHFQNFREYALVGHLAVMVFHSLGPGIPAQYHIENDLWVGSVSRVV